jgi:hypothetical protein
LAIQYRPTIGRNRDIPGIRQVPFGSKDLPDLPANEFQKAKVTEVWNVALATDA